MRLPPSGNSPGPKVRLMTARHALAGLEREGVIERRRGAGTFVAAALDIFGMVRHPGMQLFFVPFQRHSLEGVLGGELLAHVLRPCARRMGQDRCSWPGIIPRETSSGRCRMP